MILTDADMQVLDGYISYVRPLRKPECDFVLVNRVTLGQHSKLGEIMRRLVFDAIGKYIHPMCYRQIVEMESLNHPHQQGPETQFCCCQSSLSKAEIAQSCCEGLRVSTKASRKQGFRGRR